MITHYARVGWQSFIDRPVEKVRASFAICCVNSVPRVVRRQMSLFSKSPLLIFAAGFGLFSTTLLATEGVLIFQDEFERDEPTQDKEDIGNGWTANSAWRAKGHKQVDLDKGAIHITKHAEADHGVAVFHDVAFQDGVVELKFKLSEGDDLGLDFVDRELKTVHAGHLCMARVTLKNITLVDSKTGGMNLDIKARREKGDKSPELAALLKTKSKILKLDLKADDWHTMLIRVEGDQMTASIDGKPVGHFRSEGIAHPTKRMITLAVNKSAWVDDVKIWKLK